MTNLRAQSPIVPALIGGTYVGITGGVIQHLSCDGLTYNAGGNTMKVFAWDGNGVVGNQGWAYDNGSGVSSTQAFTVGSGLTPIYRPEIALVSKDFSGTVAIFAVMVYYVDIGGGQDEGRIEIQLWSGSGFAAIYFATIPNSISTLSTKTISVAGDENGHFVVVNDEGIAPYSIKHIGQWVGYIDSPTTINMGTAGLITRNNYDMSEPDADVTFDNNVNIAPFDGSVYLTFVTKQGYTIMAAAIQFRDLFPGGTWDIMTNADDLAEVPNSCITFQPSVSVNDGYQAFLGGYIPHASVAYKDDCSGTESIYLFGINRSTYALSSILLPTPVISGIRNTHPTVVTDPIDVFSVTAWDYFDGTSTFEGLAHTATYTLATNTFDPTYSGDMQVQLNGGFTQLTTASGFSQTEMIYFYIENSFGNLEYKTMPYSSTQLRKAEMNNTTKLLLYPNPVTSSININAKDNLATTILTDATGRIINTIDGNSRVLENTLNKNVVTLPNGLYFLKSTDEDGNVTTVKFLKQ